MGHQARHSAVSVVKGVNRKQTVVCCCGRCDRVRPACLCVGVFKAPQEARDGAGADRDMAADLYVMLPELPRHDADYLLRVWLQNLEHLFGKKLTEPRMCFTHAVLAEGAPGEAACVYPFLDSDVRLGFELKIALLWVSAVVLFLRICLDQVAFMEGLIQPDKLRVRISLWAEEETRLGNLPPKAKDVLDAIQYRGELPRGDLTSIVSTGERQARRIVRSLTDLGVVKAESARAPLQLAFPATLASRWMPGLFPEKAAEI